MNTAKPLGDLLGRWLEDPAHASVEIRGMSIDSRLVGPGDMFFAYAGDRFDGRDYIDNAIARGAAAVVCEADPVSVVSDPKIPIVRLRDLRQKVGVIAARFFGNPGRYLFIVGITGTNGKTSCAHLLAQAFTGLGASGAVIGTLGWGFVNSLQKTTLTTPDPVSLQGILRKLLDQGATHVCMEVSSHALSQGRVSGVPFDAALFTNLTHDHLDYHDGFKEYADAKAKLFDATTLRFAVINRDDEFGRSLVSRAKVPAWTYGLDEGDVHAIHVAAGINGLNLVLQTRAGPTEASASLIGRINVHNILAVAAVVLADGGTPSTVAAAINCLGPVPGRMELFQRNAGSAPSVVVDYAHTPDALERALFSVREHCGAALWCVFGCGGDRDRAKRPLMGAIAERGADVVIVTDDNPRHEKPTEITDEIAAGMSCAPHIINDRVRAIQWVIERAQADDWVLIAGKGHETTQQVGDTHTAMDDRAIVADCLEAAA